MEETAVHSVSPKMMISLVTLFAMRMEQYNAWKNFRTPMQSNCLDTCGKYSHNKDSRFYSNILRWEHIAFLEPHPWSAAWSIRSWMLLKLSTIGSIELMRCFLCRSTAHWQVDVVWYWYIASTHYDDCFTGQVKLFTWDLMPPT